MFPLRALTSCLNRVRNNLIWLLCVLYGLAFIRPECGDWLRGLHFGELPFSGESLNTTHLLLAVLLFCVGLAIRLEESRNLWRLSRLVTGGLLGSWLLPALTLALLATAVGWAFHGGAWQAFLAGAMLVVAMPPANSSSIWSELSGGQAAATVSVIVLGTLLSPIVTPGIVGLLTALPGVTGFEMPVSTAGLLEVLFAFVMLPAALGMAVRGLLDATRSRLVPPLLELTRAVSLGSLLLLNYVNASAVLPQLNSAPHATAAGLVGCLAIGLCGLVFLVALVVSQCGGSQPLGHRLAFVYVTGMKNTGAAWCWRSACSLRSRW